MARKWNIMYSSAKRCQSGMVTRNSCLRQNQLHISEGHKKIIRISSKERRQRRENEVPFTLSYLKHRFMQILT